jgi:LysM repeat protein
LRTGPGLVAIGLVGLLAAAGCGKPVLRIADPSLGDYYTDQEFRKLRTDQRDEYCAGLARQDSMYRAEIAENHAIIDEIATRRPALQREADSLAAVADSAGARLAAARSGAAPQAAPADARAGAGTHRVRPGESLWRISARDGIYGDGRKWPRLYEANKGTIRDPDRIYPGQELVIPHE